jgi:eukaryotic-like serine/threonine-protein kinase
MMASLETGTLLHKRYEIIQVLGQGDFGIVYQARDKRAAQTNPLVAIKQMPMQMIIDNERQADLRANLIHPNIPRIFGYFTNDNYSYLVQEFICGSDLERVLEAQPGFLDEQTVIPWAIQLCDVLGFLHTHPDHPIIFRDLKPNNIMLDGAGRIYLVDFGLARVYPPHYFDKEMPRFQHLRKGLAIGTAGYSPPEQYRGYLKPQSDIYALGATLHQLLTRRDPRKAPPFTFQEYPVRSLNPAVSPVLEAIVMKALNREVKKRYPTARAMQAALESLML